MRALVILVLIAGCGGRLPKYNYASEPDPRNKEIVLGVGDLISVNVWGDGNRDLNTEATIRPDGTITMPLIGDLVAGGETPSSLKNTIKTKLTEFVKTLQAAEVTVAVKSWRSYRFTVQGEVTKTGMFTSDQFVTVADAIALAGGPTRFARRDGVVLTRTDPKTKQTRRIPFDYDTLASGKRPDMNIFVLSGDTIYIP